MARARTTHRCKTCGMHAPRWTGRCAGCGDWNSLVEEDFAPSRRDCDGSVAPFEDSAVAVRLDEIDPSEAVPRPTGVEEFDRVMGGGFVPGSATLLGGEPGVGKSTLLLQVLRSVSRTGPALLVAAEESAHQVRLRAERLGGLDGPIMVLATTDLRAAIRAIEEVDPTLVVVDSVQTISDSSVSGPAGSLLQVRACANELVSLAKTSRAPFVLVSHVTKDGALAGPRALEHLVDTVLSVDGDRHHALRTLRAVKHRFGATGELGLFEMTNDGMEPVTDPHKYLLGDRRPGIAGSVVVPVVEGKRALLVELQALLAPSRSQAPRCVAQGVDSRRLSLVRCVIERRLELGPEYA
ncbi:MAG TPA: ATPase domain-containing protein, partial [Acidimicrobiales bacterium]|nr:ATPase domain-containing protein [Acidimicrobiales bacterium]